MNPFSAYSGLTTMPPLYIVLSAALIIWSLIWKGLGLWHSAKRGQPWWFVLFMVANTAGILEIIYLFLIQKIKRNELFKK